MTLPNELWTEICRHSATSELFNLSLVSRLIHDIAAGFMFHTINIYILHNEELYADHPHSTLLQIIENREEHAYRSWGILNKIVTDARFASFVKALRVHAASEETFEILSIVNAINHLPNLRSLHWFHSLLPVELCNEMPKSVRRLQITGFSFLNPFLDPPCKDLEELCIMQELPRFADGSPISSFIDEKYRSQIVPLFLDNLRTLRNVALSSVDMAALPVRAFEHLSILEIYYPPASTNSGLDLVLRHISNLTELALTGCVPDDYLMTLEAHPSAHPHLRSFCITSADFTPKDLAPNGLATLAHFLAGRSELRRVFLDVVTTPWDALLDTILIPSLSKLPSLVTLGLQVRYPALPSTLQSLCQALPAHLEALHVLWYSDVAPQGVQLIHPLVEGLTRCPQLSYLSATSNEFLPYGEVASLVSELANVRTVALDGQLWDVDVEDSKLGPDETARQWSDLRVESCHEGSMRHPDDYWLFSVNSNGGVDLLRIGLSKAGLTSASPDLSRFDARRNHIWSDV
ncbi:Leucine-rich repeat domain superfamily protein [Pleurotus pulmonarius]